ncbi:MAG TPA: enoyl-CoA hydratase/isomerase family protein [Pirellulales bacterium]|nr:enoyl-CoA hydratase/isomerase family protein [Pirellulales bacterium]
MTAPFVRINIHQQAGTIILNRPEKRNALNRAMLDELREALGDLHLQRNVRAVILTGAGAAFCAGMDLQEMLAAGQEEDARQRWQADADLYRDLIETMWRFPKPLIAAVNGPAMAGGAGLLLACDIVVASNEARFGLPEPLRGIVAGIVAPLLCFRLGGGQAARLLLSAATIDAQEAHRVGIFHELTGPDVLWPRAIEIAAQCSRCAGEALQLTKRLLNEMIAEQLPTLLTAGAAVSATARTTDAAAEGLAAFLEKREPKWP